MTWSKLKTIAIQSIVLPSLLCLAAPSNLPAQNRSAHTLQQAASAEAAFTAAKGLVAQKRYQPAVELLEQAVQLDPTKKKYSRRLEKIKQQGALHMLALAEQTSAKNLKSRDRSLRLAASWWPDHAEIRQALFALEQEEDRLLRLLNECISLAPRDPQAAQSRLDSNPYTTHPFTDAEATAKKQIQFFRYLVAAQEQLSKADYRQAMQEIEDSLKIYPEALEALELRGEILQAASSFYYKKIEALSSRDKTQTLLRIDALLDEAEEVCSDCAWIQSKRYSLFQDLNQHASSALARVGSNADRLRQWAECAIIASVEHDFGHDAVDGLDPVPCPSPLPDLRIGLSWRSQDANCPQPNLLNQRLAAKLPATYVVSDLLAGPDTAAARDFDLLILVESVSCGTTEIPERKVEEVSSMYKVGDQQIANPRYAQLQSELNSARYNYALQTNQWSALVWQIAITNIQTKLRKTPPYLSQPVEGPYIFQKFEAAIVSKMQGTVLLIDPQNGSTLASKRIESISEDTGWGKRGVAHTDRRGHSNHGPRLKPAQVLEQAAVETFVDESVQLAVETAPYWFLSRARLATDAGASPTAEAYYRVAAAPGLLDSNDELAALAREIRLDLRSLPANVATHWQPPTLVRNTEQTSKLTKPADGVAASPADVLESVLQAVVGIRCGPSSGTGFFVNDTGLVLTNSHVVNESSTIEVKTPSDEIFLGRLVMKDETRDLALVQVAASRTPFLPLLSSETVRVGEEIYAIGDPYGLERTVTRGIIGAFRLAEGIRFVQVDAAINHGNSGGPLLLSSGEVIGINTLGLSKDVAEGLSFAVAIEEARVAFGQSFSGSFSLTR